MRQFFLRHFSVIYNNSFNHRRFATRLICIKTVFGRDSAPDPAGTAYNAPSNPLVGWGEGRSLPIPSRRLRPLNLGAFRASRLTPHPTPIHILGYATRHATHGGFQRLWAFDVLVCPLSATELFLLQPLVCGTVFHHTSLLPPLSISRLKSRLFSLSYPAF